MTAAKPNNNVTVTAKRRVVVFFSWQSDTEETIGRNAIRAALRKASKEVEKKIPGVKLVLDEATRGVTGGINIATKVIEKIQAADIVVADVTTITPVGALRPCPNPNVSYELGFGVGEVGWERTIPLFNTAIGNFPADLPFDLIQNRTMTFRLENTELSKGVQSLSEKLAVGIADIVRVDPKRPAQLRGLSREKIEHDRDAEQIRWLLSTLHLPTLDEHIEHLPDRVRSRFLWFHAHFASVESNSLFSIYDLVLDGAVRRFARAWDVAVSHGEKYQSSANADLYSFRPDGFRGFSDDEEKAWAEILEARDVMRQALDEILARVRTSYHEVDIRKTNEAAWRDYRADVSEDEQKFKTSARASAKRRTGAGRVSAKKSATKKSPKKNK